jgi:mRNA interferase MazF
VVEAVEYIPERGDVVWVNLNPQAGHEQTGRRPCVVLSPSSYNGRVGLAVFCPITNQVKGYPFEVIVPDGLAVTGAALSDQLKSLDWRARNVEYACCLPRNTVTEILKKAGALLLP